MTGKTERDMTLLLLLMMFHLAQPGKQAGTLQSSTNSEKNNESPHPAPACGVDHPPSTIHLFCCRRKFSDFFNTNECSQEVTSTTTHGDNNRNEKEAIDNIIQTTNQSKDYYFKDLAISVVKINSILTDHLLTVTAPKVSDKTRTVQTWIPVEPFLNVSGAEQKFGIITYNSSQQFNQRNASIMSEVIRIEVVGRDIVNLTNPLKIRFPVNSYKNDRNKSYVYSCQYYDEQGDSTWKTDGCNTTQINETVVECSCDHMTPFAVLLVEVNDIDVQQWEILSYISYVGCSLSAVFSASSILSFIFNRNARAEVSSSIHVSLSGALFLLNLSFMFSEWGATLTVKEVCVFIAVTIHYSLLCSFTWMAIEALHLYLLLARVFNIYIKYYMFKLSLIGWGVPAVLVGSLLSVQQHTRPFYGTKNVNLLNSNATNPVCWITEPLILYGVNLSYFTIIFVFNTVVLITVSRQIFKLKKLDNKHKKIPVKDFSTVLGLMCLMGTSWGLVFFGSGYTSYPILYIFCISNTMQGFSIFLWLCRTARPEKQKAAHTKSASTLDTFTIEKQKESR
ncbi:adhesion G-protein coupled receptor G5-like [Carassius auratus]|uniref:Adhesion G-protein coupled receptor G5-like n=1 Tax=Carassius auratus TaxID=7957 RepID=A0A6P6PN10_CARAU|nr:adhesion G-protein coupled receptor G5-like [Carassius auratus]